MGVDLIEDRKKYDIKTVFAWQDNGAGGARLLTMPNVPHPLHTLNPRNILGRTTWDHMRKKCYYSAGYKCEACGRTVDGDEKLHAHELYSINYYAGESRFMRTVCLCPTCHVLGIHSGRALTLAKKGSPLMPKERLLKGAENLFRLLHEYNVEHPKEPPLRAYITFIDYAKWPPIAKEMEELIEKYDVKFYMEDPECTARWEKWHLIVGNKTYQTPFKDQADWSAKMAAMNAEQNAVVERNDVGGIFDEVDKILGNA